MATGLILGIETSCDETAAAVVRHGREVLSNVVASQVPLHARYGGVVPELAGREHLRHIVPVVREAIARAGVAYAQLDAVAVTEGPGLAGALLVGITFAKALAFGRGLPLIAVNHLEGHIHAVLLEAGASIEPPLAALVVSGGHTHLYLAEEPPTPGPWRYRTVGRTVDDAAGEAFDKVAKLLGLPYPGGPWIDALAPLGDPRAVPFRFAPIKPRTPSPNPRFDFSFSGIKTAVLRYVEAHAMRDGIAARRLALASTPASHPAPHPASDRAPGPAPGPASALCDPRTLNLIASFQAAVVGNLLRQTFRAAEAFGVRGIAVSGGVAANAELRRRFAAEAARRNLPIAFPSVALATDNAAMIAAAAWPRLLARDFATDAVTAAPALPLDTDADTAAPSRPAL